jgi:hypothetical protein
MVIGLSYRSDNKIEMLFFFISCLLAISSKDKTLSLAPII